MNLKSFPKTECAAYEQKILRLLSEKDDGTIEGKSLIAGLLETEFKNKEKIKEAIQNLVRQRIVEFVGEKKELVKKVEALVPPKAKEKGDFDFLVEKLDSLKAPKF